MNIKKDPRRFNKLVTRLFIAANVLFWILIIAFILFFVFYRM
jgi:hypothetical protein